MDVVVQRQVVAFDPGVLLSIDRRLDKEHIPGLKVGGERQDGYDLLGSDSLEPIPCQSVQLFLSAGPASSKRRCEQRGCAQGNQGADIGVRGDWCGHCVIPSDDRFTV
ncbi:MAG: hypothetical protein ACFHWZ_15500 [Phycisphaerales bacterium]